MKITKRKHDKHDLEEQSAINISEIFANLGIQDNLRGWECGSVVEYLPSRLRQFHKKKDGYQDKVNINSLICLHLLS